MSFEKEHQNLDNIFLRNVKFNKSEKVAIQGLTDFSIIPPLCERLKKDNRVAIISKDRKTNNDVLNYIEEFGKEDLFATLIWDLNKINKLKDEQFDVITIIGIKDLETEPIASLSNHFRLLKEMGKLIVLIEDNDRNDIFLRRLLYEAEMGEMIGLLEKVGFSNRFYIKRVITKYLKALIITAIKPRLNINEAY